VKAVSYRVVVKNLVLIAAGLAVGGGTVRYIRKEQGQHQQRLQEQTSRTNEQSHFLSMTAK